MLIGLILLGLVAVLLFFGVAGRVANNCGIPYFLALGIVGALIAGAFVPAIHAGGAVIGTAGFILPLAVGAVLVYFCSKRREVFRALVTASVTAAGYIAAGLLLYPIADGAVTVAVQGVLCGTIAYFAGRTELAALTGVFLGMPLGQVAATVTAVFAYGGEMSLGGGGAYDALIIAAVLSPVLYEAVSAVKRFKYTRRKRVMTEAADEFDPDEYKKYFDE